jgi:aldehyde dehydrogenase (NAD+)
MAAKPSLTNLADELRSAQLEVGGSYAWRRQQLEGLRQMLHDRAPEFEQALLTDLGKNPVESEITEIGFVLAEISHALRHLKKWMRPSRVHVPMSLWPARAHTVSEPLGAVLIISPWNYPLQLSLAPLVGALAAGNAVVLKPSEISPATSAALAEFVPQYLDASAIRVVEGGPVETTALLRQQWDHIFYTGNEVVAGIIATAAAKHLTPTTLELGGKSPTYIDGTANLAQVAKRLAWAKFVNAGQTCVAPDYVLVTPDVQDNLVEALKLALAELYGADPHESADYGRIVSSKHLARLKAVMPSRGIVIGGKVSVIDKYIAPTVVTGVQPGDPIMRDEIFGPILPMLTVANAHEAIEFINSRPKPLALYVYSNDRGVRRAFERRTSSGALDFNVGLAHMSVPNLPFGGVGLSGSGAYHGKRSFDVFSHEKAVFSKSLTPDTLTLIYPPYTSSKGRLARGLLRRISR